MSHGLPNFFGATAAWLCLAPVAFARGPVILPSTFASGSTPTHYFASVSLFLIWITFGIFLVVAGLLAFAPFRFHARKLDPLSGPTHRRTELDLVWTVIPVLLAVLLLATARINFAIQTVSKPGAAVDVTEIGYQF